MSFDRRDIRPSMDVFTLDNAYLGTVLRVVAGSAAPDRGQAPEPARQSSAISGEMLGPAPTQPLGNQGPLTQSAREWYGTRPDGAEPIGRGAITVGTWWGLVALRTIPLDAVLSVSLERVILRVKQDELARQPW